MTPSIYRIFYFFLKASVIGRKEHWSGDRRFYYAARSLHGLSLRFPERSGKDPLLSLRVAWRLIKAVEKKTPHKTIKAVSAILDTHNSSEELRVNYISRITGKKEHVYLAKEGLHSTASTLDKFNVYVCIIILTSVSFVSGLFRKNKVHFPLLILQGVECFNLIKTLKQNNIWYLYYFSIYENDANLVAYLLQKQGIKINKIASEVPLTFWNKTVLSSELSLCFKYQEEEVKFYANTMFIEKTNLWIPELSYEAPRKYIDNNFTMTKGTIGFYSSANWLRQFMGDKSLGLNETENEDQLLKDLLSYTEQKKELALLIYLHPLEKKAETWQLVQEHYSSAVGRSNVRISDPKKRSADFFEEAEIGVALYSTILFERIFFGFKTLLMPLGYDDFPLKHSTLSNICIIDSKSLCAKLNLSLAQSNENFFSENNLKGYAKENFSHFFKQDC